MTLVRFVSASTLVAVFALGCGGEEVKYEPRPAPSGAKANLPAVPNVPNKPIKYLVNSHVHFDHWQVNTQREP